MDNREWKVWTKLQLKGTKSRSTGKNRQIPRSQCLPKHIACEHTPSWKESIQAIVILSFVLYLILEL